VGRLFLRSVILSLALILLGGAQSCHAGSFAVPGECDTLSTDPPLFIDRIHLIRETCQFTAQQGSFLGSAIVPILGCVGSSSVSCSFDSTTGVATFTVNPCSTCCLIRDDAGLIVASQGGCFFLDGPATTQYICMSTCWSPTPASVKTWGSVKSTYR
jgi:hypothetical protein